MEGLYKECVKQNNLKEKEELDEIDEDLMNMILEESVLELSKSEREIDEDVSRIRRNYEESLRKSLEAPSRIYAPNLYDDSDVEEWDDTSDLEE
jgi:phosphomevalonate kinase